VIYYYFDSENPIYLFAIFAKNERADLSGAERLALSKVVAQIKDEFRAQRTKR